MVEKMALGCGQPVLRSLSARAEAAWMCTRDVNTGARLQLGVGECKGRPSPAFPQLRQAPMPTR
jgi:hypothetical protein